MYGTSPFNNSNNGMQLIDAIRQRQPLSVLTFHAILNPRLVQAHDEKGLLPIHYAVCLSTPDVVGYLVNAFPQGLAHKDANGSLPIHMAAEVSSSVDVIEFLADRHPPSLQAKTKDGWLPLHAAAAGNSVLEIVQCLVRKCPEALDVTTNLGHLPLHCATVKAPATIVQYLVEQRPQALWVEDQGGDLPLHCAVESAANIAVVKCLVDAGPRALREKNVQGRLPLHIAAQHAPIEVIKLLTERNKEVLRVKDQDGALPVHIAAQHQPFPVVKYLAGEYPGALGERTLNDGRVPLHVAAQFAPIAVVQHLADKHSQALEAKDDSGDMPLHVAAKHANLAVVQALATKCPGSLTYKNHKGQRPVDVASRERTNDANKDEIVIWLENATKRHASRGGSERRRIEHEEPDIVVASARDSDIRVYGSDVSNPSNRAKAQREDQDIRVWGDERPPPDGSSASHSPVVSDPHQTDRDRIRKVVDHTSCEPVAVSGAYVKSILNDTVLGEGFFGTVYKGNDPMLSREFAIKSINTEILRGGSPQDLEAAMKTFRTEQEALSRFRHPNIAALFAYTDPLSEGGAAGGYHLVYELAEKGSLDAFLSDDYGRSRLGSFQRRVQIAIDVLTAIQFLHKGSQGVESCFHRDIKSANIVIKRDFTAQLIDCGLAKFVNDRVTTTGVKGTRGYVCPYYVKTGKYSAACDLYSLGVVLLELWTGRLQNHESVETGETFNFGLQYIDEERDVNTDADPAMDLTDPRPSYSTRFTDVSLRCISEKVKDRPSGSAVLNELKDILVECSPALGAKIDGGGKPGSSAGPRDDSEPTDACSTCRTLPIFHPYNSCFLCLVRQGAREEFSNMAAAAGPSSDGQGMEAISKQIEDLGRQLNPTLHGLSRKMEDVERKLDATLPIMAQLDRRLNNQIPRTFLLLPADMKNGWTNPRSWLRSKVQTKYYLYFVCAVSQQAVSPPIKLKVSKDWVRKVAPVLATGLFVLQVSMKAGLNVSLDLDGAASNLFQVSSAQINDMLKELTDLLDETPGSRGLLDRLKAKQLSDDDVKELSGDAYELVIEKAVEQNGWRSRMEPVRAPPSPKVFWVATSVAHDPKHKLEVVKA